jgi:hypothetical protein
MCKCEERSADWIPVRSSPYNARPNRAVKPRRTAPVPYSRPTRRTAAAAALVVVVAPVAVLLALPLEVEEAPEPEPEPEELLLPPPAAEPFFFPQTKDWQKF